MHAVTTMASTSLDVGVVMGAALAIIGAIIGMVKWGVERFDKLSQRQESAFKESIDLISKSTERVAHATEQAAVEAKERNGHLGEQNIAIAELVKGQGKDLSSIRETNAVIATTLSKSAIIAAEDRDILTGSPQIIHEQHVEHQVVDQSTIKEETVDHKQE